MTKKRITALLVAGLGAYAATFALLGATRSASAAFRGMNSGFCHGVTPDATPITNQGSITNNTSALKVVYCPILSDSLQSAPSVTLLDVEGRGAAGAGGTTSDSRVCVSAVGDFFNCGSPAPWSVLGAMSIFVDTSFWRSSTLPPRTNLYFYVKHQLTPTSELIGMLLN
jgi:hypothetical protein